MSIVERLRQVDWTFFLACVSWGLTTALMLYVKLKKKADALPVLILLAEFLLYMNAGDLFKSFRIYTIACVNRRILAHQFVSTLLLGFLANSYTDIFVLMLVLSAALFRPGFGFGKSGIPILGPFLVRPMRSSIVALSIATQCFGFVTGTILSETMLADVKIASGRSFSPAEIPADPAVCSLVSAFVIGLVCSSFVTAKAFRGKLQTVLASGLIAAFSRVLPFSSLPVLMMPILATISSLFPGAVFSVSSFIPQLSSVKDLPNRLKFGIFVEVFILHAIGALLAGYLSSYMFPSTVAADSPFVSRRAIAQEFFFSALVGFVSTRRPGLAPLVMTAGYLATTGNDMVHLCSAISLGSSGLGEGRLIARLLWQTIGSLLGSTLVTWFVDNDKIDFDPMTSVTRTTDGKTIRNRVVGK